MTRIASARSPTGTGDPLTRHSLPIGYDEAVYVNQVIFDRATPEAR